MQQTAPADEVILSLASRADAPSQLPPSVRVVLGPRGLTTQRNAGIDALSADIELVTFFDDDAEPAADYLEKAKSFAQSHPEVVLFDGKVAADGAISGEIDRA